MLPRRRCLYALYLLVLAAPLARADHGWGMNIAPNPAYGGDPLTGSIGRERSGGFITPPDVFTVSSSDPDFVTVPARVVLDTNVLDATFPVETPPVAVRIDVTITVTRGLESRTLTLSLMPLALKELTLQRPRTVGGHSLTGTLYLYGPAPAGGLPVALLSGDPTRATVPSQVVVPEGARSVEFPILTSLQFGVVEVTLTAEWHGEVSATLGLVPPPRYLVEDVSPRPGERAVAKAIAENGDVAGFTITDGYEHGFLLHNDAFTVMGTLSGSNSFATGLNEFGQVVGGSEVPFVWRDGAFQELGGLGATTYGSQPGTAYGINDAGDAVGESFASPIPAKGDHPFYKPYGKPMMDLVPDSLEGRAEEINNAGRIVGSYHLTPDGNTIAFRAGVDPVTSAESLETVAQEGWDVSATDINDNGDALVVMDNPLLGSANYLWAADGSRRELPLGRGRWSAAKALNDNGEIVGVNVPSDPLAAWFPFHLAPDGAIINLNDAIDPASGWRLDTPTEINNAGQIVGSGTIGSATETFRAYRLTPLSPSDVDRNGSINALDVAAALRIAAGFAPSPPFGIGDMDDDHRVTLADAARIARLIGTGP